MGFIMDTVLDIGHDEFYRAARYQIPLTVVLVNSKNKEIFDLMDQNLRKTDMIQQLTSDLIIVFLSHTNYKNGISFVQKIEKDIEFTYSLDEFKGSKDSFVNNLFELNKQYRKVV